VRQEVRLAILLAVVLGAAARVEATCTVSATGVNFGTYNVFDSNADTSTGTVTYRCGNTDHDIQITISKGSSSTYNPRTLTKSSEILQYNLFRDSGFATIWGDGTGGTGTYTQHNPPNQDVMLTVYGRISALQDVSAGSYGDTVVVTVNF
jgi:spore coat protein U-like protein